VSAPGAISGIQLASPRQCSRVKERLGPHQRHLQRAITVGSGGSPQLQRSLAAGVVGVMMKRGGRVVAATLVPPAARGAGRWAARGQNDLPSNCVPVNDRALAAPRAAVLSLSTLQRRAAARCAAISYSGLRLHTMQARRLLLPRLPACQHLPYTSVYRMRMTRAGDDAQMPRIPADLFACRCLYRNRMRRSNAPHCRDAGASLALLLLANATAVGRAHFIFSFVYLRLDTRLIGFGDKQHMVRSATVNLRWRLAANAAVLTAFAQTITANIGLRALAAETVPRTAAHVRCQHNLPNAPRKRTVA